jgi:hypothetical protein
MHDHHANVRASHSLRRSARCHRASSRKAIALYAAMLVALPLLAYAGTIPSGPPGRIDNVYGGFDHQPMQSEVQNREHAAGVEPSDHQQMDEDATLQQLYRQLLPGT